MKMKKFRYSFCSFLVICLYLGGISLRLFNLNEIPPGFYYDEGIPQIQMYITNEMTKFTIPENIYVYLHTPGLIILTIYTSIYGIPDNVQKIFYMLRLGTSLTGILLLLIFALTMRTIKQAVGCEDYVSYLVTVVIICLAYPFLIHFSRYGSGLTSSLFYLIYFLFFVKTWLNGVKYKYIIASALSLAICFEHVIYVLVGFLTFIYILIKKASMSKRYIRRLIVSVCLFIMLFSSASLLFSPFFTINFSRLLCIPVAQILFPHYVEFIKRKTTTALMGLNFLNVLLYLHPSYLLWDGGAIFMQKGIGKPFRNIGDWIIAYRWNVHFGVLGYWGWCLYLMVIYYLLFFRYLRDYERLFCMLTIIFFFTYITTSLFYLYDNPVSIREQLFYTLLPDLLYAFLLCVRKYFSKGYKLLLLFITACVILTASIFTPYYFECYPGNYYTLASNLAFDHNNWNIVYKNFLKSKKVKYEVAIFLRSYANFTEQQKWYLTPLDEFYLSFIKLRYIKYNYSIIVTNNLYLREHIPEVMYHFLRSIENYIKNNNKLKSFRILIIIFTQGLKNTALFKNIIYLISKELPCTVINEHMYKGDLNYTIIIYELVISPT